MEEWIVICITKPMQDSDLPPGFGPESEPSEGQEMVLATQRVFDSEDSANRYASTMWKGWTPRVAKLS